MTTTVPDATMLRLSRYHCFLGEMHDERAGTRLRSREIAAELGLSEETVRRDLSFVPIEGRPGVGYDPEELFWALQQFLDLSELHPFVAIGNTDVLRGLTVTFPAGHFGLKAAGYFSERSDDAGATIDDLEVLPLPELTTWASRLGVNVALVAVAPDAVDETLELLAAAGVRGVLMLTPVLRPRHPEGMNVTYFRMPCALKSLVGSDASDQAASAAASSCCADS